MMAQTYELWSPRIMNLIEIIQVQAQISNAEANNRLNC